MSARRQVGEALDEGFSAALLLTGSIGGAEQAVENAIDRLGPDLSAEALLAETARSALRQRKCQDDLPAILPLELQALSLLSPADRNCFILRVLMGFDREACSEILKLPQDDVEEALHRSLLDLPMAVESIRRRRPVNRPWLS
jgi:DNA-directed RNA polymerase specialized sigma24 family protein